MGLAAPPAAVPAAPTTRRAFLRLLGGGAAVPLALPLLGGCDPAAGGGDGSAGGATTGPTATVAPARLRFPDGFAWGASTSAYQIEGAAREDGKGESIWDRFSHTPGRIRGGDTGDEATDHYHRYVEDLDLMRDLGLRSYRFSVSWPRVLPDGAGTPNPKGLDFYRRLVDGLVERDITPVVTLFHWDLPQALQDRGGWESRDTARRFADYAAVVFQALGGAVDTWLTLNEPKTVVQVGYLYGAHAPGKRDESAAFVALHHLLLAHGLAVQALRAANTGGRIGPALNLAPTYPADDSKEAADAARWYDGFENRLYLDPVLRGEYPKDMLDWIAERSPMADRIHDGDLATIATRNDHLGVQYYNPIVADAARQRVYRYPRSEATWQEIFPEGLYDILVRVKRDYGDLPLLITENGIPTPDALGSGGVVDDPGRIAFLRDHFTAAHKAIQEGVDLRGYYVWSLMDNFEWAEGFGQRWGLVYVDYDTQRRIPKSSARWYRDVIRANGV
jgi:beta-glucosidase